MSVLKLCGHAPRLKVQNNTADNVQITATDHSHSFSVSIPTTPEDEPKKLAGEYGSLKQKDITTIFAWVKKYAQPLVDYWFGKITYTELKQKLFGK